MSQALATHRVAETATQAPFDCDVSPRSDNRASTKSVLDSGASPGQASGHSQDQDTTEISLFMGPLLNAVGTDSLEKALGEDVLLDKPDNPISVGIREHVDSTITDFDLPSRAVADKLVSHYGE